MAQLSHHDALIHVMVTTSAADRSMSDLELAKIGDIIKTLPVFADFDESRLVTVARECSEILQENDGLDRIMNNAYDIIPAHLHETAYALAVDVAAADLRVEQEELRLLQILRNKLGVDRLTAAAIERGARARHQTL